MTDRNVYALNTTSGVVSQVDADFLSHPTLGKDLIEVDNPNVCISCGDQPDEVTTTDGDVIDLRSVEDQMTDAEQDELLSLSEPEPNEGEK